VDWFIDGGDVEWLLGHMPCGGCVPMAFTYGLPLRIKEITMSSMFRVLLVQPYDNMGSVLIEYDVRVQPGVTDRGWIWGTARLSWLNTFSERSCLILLSR
jgi:hypothetical protein